MDFRTPAASLEKANLSFIAHAEARENRYRGWGTARVSEGNLSIDELALLVSLRTIFDVDIETSGTLDELFLLESFERLPLAMRSEFNFYSTLEKKGSPAVTLSSDNSFRLASKRLGEGTTFTLTSTSRLDESRLSLSAGGMWTAAASAAPPFGLGRLDANLEDVPLERLAESADLFGFPLGARISGNASSRLTARFSPEGDVVTTGTVSIAGLSVAMDSSTTRGKASEPVNLELTCSVSAPLGAMDLSETIPYPSTVRLRHLGLTFGRDLSFDASGLLVRDAPFPRAEIEMGFKAQNLGWLAETARDSGFDLPLTMEGTAGLLGRLECRSLDESNVGLKAEGSLVLDSFSGRAEDLAEWKIADFVMPLKVDVSAPWNTKRRSTPRTRIGFDLGRVAAGVDRIFGFGLEVLDADLALSAKGHCEGTGLVETLLGNGGERPVDLEWFLESFQGEILDIAEIRGQGWGRWKGTARNPVAGFSGQGPFTARLNDLGAVASMLGQDLKTTGTVAFENGKWKVKAETATIGGELAVLMSEGEYSTDWLEWEDLKAGLELSVTDRLSSMGLAIPPHTLTGEIEIGKILSSGLELDDLRFRVDSTAGEIHAETLEGNLYGGKLEASATAHPSRTTPTLTANLNVDSLDLSSFCREYQPGDVKMAGKVRLWADLSCDLGAMPEFEAEVTQVSRSILMDRPTVEFLMFGYVKLLGADIPPDTAAAIRDFKKIFGERNMVPFSTLGIKVRYSAPKFEFLIRMENRNFNLTLEPKIDENVVFDFLRSRHRALISRFVGF